MSLEQFAPSKNRVREGAEIVTAATAELEKAPKPVCWHKIGSSGLPVEVEAA